MGALVLLAACETTKTGGPATSATVTDSVESSTAATTPPTTITPTIPLPTTAPPTTFARPGEVEFLDGKLLGIEQRTLMSFAADVLGVTPVQVDPASSEFDLGCSGTPNPWVIHTGGLTMVFEDWGNSAENARLTNWSYVGGPAAGFTQIVAPWGIRIGDPRTKVLEADPDADDDGDVIYTYAGFLLRFGIENDVVTWFGIVDCVMEGSED